MFLPFGLPNKGVIDPEQQMRDFSQALSLLQQIDQHRFREDTFNDQDQLKNDFATIMSCSTSADLKASSTNAPVITKALGVSNLYHVPYNRGLEEIDMDQDWPEWTSPYPELVFMAFSWQWCRAPNRSFGSQVVVNVAAMVGGQQYEVVSLGTTTWPAGVTYVGQVFTAAGGLSGTGTVLDLSESRLVQVRMQMRLSIDGAFQPGTGPMTFALDGLYRGAGLGERSTFSVCKTVAVLPAGTHRVSAFAGQAVGITVSADDANDGVKPFDAPPVDRIVLGNRGMVLMRCAVGAGLTG
jgi:hypothetical protein